MTDKNILKIVWSWNISKNIAIRDIKEIVFKKETYLDYHVKCFINSAPCDETNLSSKFISLSLVNYSCDELNREIFLKFLYQLKLKIYL